MTRYQNANRKEKPLEASRRVLVSAGLLALVVWQAVVAQSAWADSTAAGRSPSGWFVTKRVNDHTFMISMPRYFQQNVAYLLIGSQTAILFDTGPGVYPILPVARRLTKLPILAIPSHLHYDHVGNLSDFAQVGLIDTPTLKSEIKGGEMILRSDQLMLREPYPRAFKPFKVTEWLGDGTPIDLGGLTILTLATPGHTPDSVSLIDEAAGTAFSGDLVGEHLVWALTHGAKLAQIAESARRILQDSKINQIYEAHSEVPLPRQSLSRIAGDIDKIESGLVPATKTCFDGADMNTYKVADTDYTTGDLPPLATNLSPFKMSDGPCRSAK